MDLNLNNKVVFIAGSSRGIGYAIAEGFAKEGSCVVISGRNVVSLEDAEQKLVKKYGQSKILALNVDLSDKSEAEKAVTEIIEHFDSLDCIVANVGSGKAKNGWNLKAEDWDEVLKINFLTSINIIESCLPYMIKNNSGNVIIIGSIVALDSLLAPLTYSAAKSALRSYSKNLAVLVAKNNIRVNYVAPGNILFEGSNWDKKLKENRKQIERYINNEVPMKRFGTPEEIANISVFLSSERASFITGACVTVDGGQTKGI